MKEYFKFFSIFFIITFLSLSIFVVLVNAGVLEFSVNNNNDGIYGSKITITWYQGDDTKNLGPNQCGLNGIPGDNVPYAFKNSDSSQKPNTDSDPTGCNYCGGNSACNEGLAAGVEDYRCLTDGRCQKCQACPPSGCGFGENCDTSSGTCNSKCVCDPATCTGTYCSGNDIYSYGCSGNSCSGKYSSTCKTGQGACNGRSRTIYDGCSGGSCASHTVTYDCDGCQNKQPVTVTYKGCGCASAGNRCETCKTTVNICPGSTPPDLSTCSSNADCPKK